MKWPCASRSITAASVLFASAPGPVFSCFGSKFSGVVNPSATAPHLNPDCSIVQHICILPICQEQNEYTTTEWPGVSGRGVACVLRVAALQPSDRQEGAEPGAGRGEQHIERVLGVADHREG